MPTTTPTTTTPTTPTTPAPTSTSRTSPAAAGRRAAFARPEAIAGTAHASVSREGSSGGIVKTVGRLNGAPPDSTRLDDAELRERQQYELSRRVSVIGDVPARAPTPADDPSRARSRESHDALVERYRREYEQRVMRGQAEPVGYDSSAARLSPAALKVRREEKGVAIGPAVPPHMLTHPRVARLLVPVDPANAPLPADVAPLSFHWSAKAAVANLTSAKQPDRPDRRREALTPLASVTVVRCCSSRQSVNPKQSRCVEVRVGEAGILATAWFWWADHPEQRGDRGLRQGAGVPDLAADAAAWNDDDLRARIADGLGTDRVLRRAMRNWSGWIGRRNGGWVVRAVVPGLADCGTRLTEDAAGFGIRARLAAFHEQSGVWMTLRRQDWSRMRDHLGQHSAIPPTHTIAGTITRVATWPRHRSDLEAKDRCRGVGRMIGYVLETPPPRRRTVNVPPPMAMIPLSGVAHVPGNGVDAERRRVLSALLRVPVVARREKVPLYEPWRNAKQMLADVGMRPDAEAIGGPPGASVVLIRHERDRGFVPGNVTWGLRSTLTRKLIQSGCGPRSREIVHRGRRVTLSQLAEEHGLKATTLRSRLYVHGMPLEEALARPLNARRPTTPTTPTTRPTTPTTSTPTPVSTPVSTPVPASVVGSSRAA